ncbi:MAG TPA: hypothetical protein VHX11_08570 [Acidobacteriaceae bacterium]|nr:hypothetical protein [Acidobacteriaceae bacterium]
MIAICSAPAAFLSEIATGIRFEQRGEPDAAELGDPVFPPTEQAALF